MLTTWFATPALLWLLYALPVCSFLLLYAHIRRQRAVAKLASALPLRKQTLVRPRVRRWRTFAILLGMMLVVIACAGPQWGIDLSAQERKGRDVIIVLDLSRSMNAEQPSRRELALRALHHLADKFQEDGANRVAFVAFASKAHLFFPLTQDYDHLRHTLKQIETSDYPQLADKDPVHGTRIGAALKLAVNSIDPARVNRPIVVLVSDGDDPAGDEEWLQGALHARAKQIRVHTVGVGNPHKDETIPIGNEIAQFGEQPVLTKLYEDVLDKIARRTDGRYLPARSEPWFELGSVVQHLLDADELREETPPEGALPTYQLRYAWFLLPAALLFMLAMLSHEGPSRRKMNGERPTMNRKPHIAAARKKSIAVLVLLLAVAGMSAADPPTSESLLRQGNEAFERREYEAAIKFYEEAEALTRDPGLIAFNRAAAHYRLGQFKDAIDCYRRAVEDDGAPSDRKARAFFDLGNALVQFAGDNPRTLAEAVAAYRACLHQSDLPPDLRAKARHNLELTQLLWLKLNPKEAPEPAPPPKKDPFDDQKPEDADNGYKPVDPTQKFVTQPSDDVKPGQKSEKYRVDGTVTSVPDTEKVEAISQEEALRLLAIEARRIANERRRHRNSDVSAKLSTKDW